MNTLTDYARMVERALPAQLDGAGPLPPLLREAMAYSLMAGGKRLRPAMLLAACDMLGFDMGGALAYACAVEMIHTYSLIHDDLPGMDDDVLRRGMPTSHVKFGVGQAILAGDGLLSLAVEIMVKDVLAHPRDVGRVLAMDEIVHGAGAGGMVAGQCLDLQCQRARRGGAQELCDIQLGKTCRMFMHPLRAAGHLAGAAHHAIQALGDYGLAFGRMFQTADDLLDVEGDKAALGKSVGKDQAEGKLTAVSVYGADGARKMVDEQLAKALDALSCFDQRADFLRGLVISMKGRKS